MRKKSTTDNILPDPQLDREITMPSWASDLCSMHLFGAARNIASDTSKRLVDDLKEVIDRMWDIITQES